MFRVHAPNKSLQRQFKFSSPIQPGSMNAVSGAINIATPNTFEAHQDVAANLLPQLLHLVGELSCRPRMELRNWAKHPFALGPILAGKEPHLMAGFNHSVRESLQISFGTAAGR